jgi:hypothetical protein
MSLLSFRQHANKKTAKAAFTLAQASYQKTPESSTGNRFLGALKVCGSPALTFPSKAGEQGLFGY